MHLLWKVLQIAPSADTTSELISTSVLCTTRHAASHMMTLCTEMLISSSPQCHCSIYRSQRIHLRIIRLDSSPHKAIRPLHGSHILLHHLHGRRPTAALLAAGKQVPRGTHARLQRASQSPLRVDAFHAVRRVDVLDQCDLVAGRAALAGDDGAVGEEEFPDL